MEQQKQMIAGFWRRLGAFIIDVIILGVVGILLGQFLAEQFVQLGAWGRLVGFPIAVAYFAILNSHIAKGQTIGKRVLKLKVIHKDGSYLNLQQSFFRYVIIAIPYFLNGARFADDIMFSMFGYVLSFAIFGLGSVIVYLFIFNRKTRQSLHDKLLGSYVVNAGVEERIEDVPLWPVHTAVCALLLLMSVVTPYFTGTLVQNDFFAGLFNTRGKILDMSQVSYATLTEGVTTMSTLKTGTNTTTFVSTQVFLNVNKTENMKLALEIANLIMQHHATAKDKDVIKVMLSYGYDIGIASSWANHNYTFPTASLAKQTGLVKTRATYF